MIAHVSPSHRPLLLLLALTVCWSVLGGAHPVAAQSATEAQIGKVILTAEPGAAQDAATLADLHGEAITTAWPQFVSLFGTEPAETIQIAYVASLPDSPSADMRWITDAAWVSLDGRTATIAVEPFLSLSPTESANVLRNIVSRAFIQAAGGNQVPPGLSDGIARYVDVPVMARQARLGSLVQGLHQAGTLPTWEQIAASEPSTLTAEERTANAYALVAFLTDRYGAVGLQRMVQTYAANPALDSVLTTSFGQSITALNPSWQNFLPRWFASGWRENAVSAFDLSRAEDLFSRGAYEASAAEAERSQVLFSDLNDQSGLARVEALLAQNAVGLQADQSMLSVEAALTAHDYAGASLLLNQAEDLFASLPEEHRPTTMIDRYRSLSESGLQAEAWLAQAHAESDGWLEVASARNDAVAAGNAFAALGDTERHQEASALVERIDTRLWRVGYILSALVLVLIGWLLAWTWLRHPARLQWGSRIRRDTPLAKAR